MGQKYLSKIKTFFGETRQIYLLFNTSLFRSGTIKRPVDFLSAGFFVIKCMNNI